MNILRLIGFINYFLIVVSPISAYGQQTINKLNTNELKLPKETVSRVLQTDGSGVVRSSTTTNTQLGFLDATSSIQTQLNSKANASDTVNLTGNQSVSGVKTFTGNIISSSTTNGFHPCPSMTNAQIVAIGSPSNGDCAHDTTNDKWLVYNSTDTVWEEMGGAGGISNWVTATPYDVDDVVIESLKIYQCLTAHTSGTFATDLAANKWIEISNTIGAKYQAGSLVSAKEIQVPNNLLTETASGKYLNETGNNNLLANPSFEHTTASTNWSLTNGSSAEETTVKIHGEKSLRLTLTAQTLEFFNTSTRYASQLADGVQGVASIRVKTTVSGIFVCPIQNSVTNYSNCSQVSSSGAWGLYTVPFVLGGTNNGIDVISGTLSSGVVTPGNVTGDVYVDDAYVGTDSQTSYGRSMTSWYASVAQGTLQDSTAEIRFASVNPFTIKGDSSLLTYTDDAGSTRTRFTANQRVYVSASFGSAITTTNASVSIRVNGSTAQTGSQIRTANDNSTVTFTGYLNAGDYLTFDAGSVITTGASVYAAITATSDPIQLFASQCGAACENIFSAKVSSSGVVSNENTNWINGNCSITGTAGFSCTYNTGIFTLSPNCTVTVDNGSAQSIGQIIDNTSTTSSLVKYYTTNTSTGAENARGVTISCQKQGADYISSRTIVGSFKEVLTKPRINKPIQVSAYISATEVITEDDSVMLSSCTNADPSVCTFTSSYWLSAPKCWAQGTTATDLATVNSGTTTSSVSIDRATSGTPFALWCEGAKL